MRFNSCLMAALALSFVALGQQPKDDDDDVIDVKVVGPEVQVIEADDVDVAELVPMQGLGSIAIAKIQDADQKGGKKARKQDDKKKSETIEKEIDLGDGRKMKIIITGDAKQGEVNKFFGTFAPGLSGRRLLSGDPPKGDFKFFRSPDALTLEPHEFRFERMPDGDGKESFERAMRAFERAREAFIRSFKEGEARERRDGDRKEAREPRESRRTMIAGPDREARVMVERKMKAKADKDDADKDDDKSDREKKIEGRRARVANPDIPFLGVRSGAEAKHAAEIDELRKEIKELEKIVRDLKDALPKKKD